MREELEFPKNRDVNHYHHAFDAFLAARIGTYLLKRFPNLQAFFTYGKFKKADVKKLRGFNFIRDITHAEGKIVAKDTGEVVWDKQRDVDELDRIYNFKRMLITHEVRFETADLFKQTVYGAKDSKEAGGSKQLIPKKKGYPVDIYGGYTQETGSYLSVVRLTKKAMYAVVKISMRDAAKLAVAKSISEQKENETLNDIIDEKLSKISKNGKIAHELFEVVLPRVGQKTLFKNSKYNLFLVNSDTYMHNYQELWMPREYQKMWKDISLSKYGDAQTEDQLDQIFGFIVSQVNSYFNLYDINQFRKKLNDAADKFATLPIHDTDDMQGKIATIGQLLIGLQANAARSDLRNLDIKTPFGKLQIGNGITLDLDTSVIYQSPTGLFERKILLADL